MAGGKVREKSHRAKEQYEHGGECRKEEEEEEEEEGQAGSALIEDEDDGRRRSEKKTAKKKRAHPKKSRRHHRRHHHSETESESESESETEDSDSGSSSSSESSESSGSDGSEGSNRRSRHRHRSRREKEDDREKRRRRHKEKKRRRKREKLKKEEEEDKKRRRRKKKKKEEEERRKAKLGPVTESWGKFGIIKEIDMWNKRPEFSAWLGEVKKVNLETLPTWEEKQMFKEYMEDFNTATLPKKYYDLDAYHRRMMMKEISKGMKMPVATERTEFNDEEQRWQEIRKAREQRKEAEVEALKRSMQSGMAQAMREQAQLREEMQYQFRLGNLEAAAAIQRRLDPDAPPTTGFK